MAASRGWVSQSEAARREGVTRQWINKLIAQKRLDVNAKRQVRLAQVKHLRADGLDPSRGKHKAQTKKAPAPVKEAGAIQKGSFTAVRTRREQQMALLAELDVRKRIGELVEWAKVEALNASTAVMIREAMLAIPARVAAILAAETDEAKVEELLDTEMRTGLTALSILLKKPG